MQFKRAANIYFLIITVLTCMEFSPKVTIEILTIKVTWINDRYFCISSIFYNA